MMLAPGQELVHYLRVGPASVAVADVGREEFDKPFLRALSGRGDEVGAPQVAMGTSWFINCALPTIVPHDATPL